MRPRGDKHMRGLETKSLWSSELELRASGLSDAEIASHNLAITVGVVGAHDFLRGKADGSQLAIDSQHLLPVEQSDAYRAGLVGGYLIAAKKQEPEPYMSQLSFGGEQ